MRVLQVIPSVASIRGGPSQAVLEMVPNLLSHGIDTEIVATDDNGASRLAVSVDGCITEFSGAPVRFFPRFSPSLRALREFSYSAPLGRWLRKNVTNYDLVHVHALFSYTSSIAMQICRDRKVPYICRPSGLLCNWSLSQSAYRKQLFLKLFDRANLNGAVAIEYTSTLEKEEAIGLGLDAPSYVLPYGLDFAPLIFGAREAIVHKLSFPPTDRILLFMSRLHHKKGADLLLKALASLPAQDIQLVIAGDGDDLYKDELRSIVANSWLNGRTHFVGFVSGDWKQKLLQGVDLFILPSFSESFAIVVLEALAAGTKIVTTPGVPLSKIVASLNAGWICEPSVDGLSDVISKALRQDSDMVMDWQSKQFAHERVKHACNWETISKMMVDAYTSAINGKVPESYILENVLRLEQNAPYLP